MAEEIKAQDVMNALGELRTEMEKKAPDMEKVERLNTALDEQEEKNQQVVAEQKRIEGLAEDQKERIDALEVEIARAGPSVKQNYRDSDEYKAMNELCRGGLEMLNSEQKALLRTDSDVSGGFLVASELDSEITKKITEISNIRSIARVRTISSKSLEVPVRATIPTAAYEGEAEQGGEDTSTYSNETLTAFRQSVTIPVTMDMLQDSAFDMEAEIFGDASESFAQGEGLNHVSGDGVKKPFGFLADPRTVANVRTSSTSATIDADDVILLTGDLKVGYSPVYVMNRLTLADLRTKKSTDGVFLWQPGLNGVVANTINGFPYLIANDMPDIAANSLSMAFGDFRRGYTIVDRTGLSVVRDEFTQKKKAIVEFTLHRWNTGQVTLPEAIKILKTKA